MPYRQIVRRSKSRPKVDTGVELVRQNAKTLEEFGIRIEARLAKASGPTAAVDLVCRLMTSKDPRISALMTCKWVEWRYGKAKEHVEHSGAQAFAIQIVNHIPRPETQSVNANELVAERSEPEKLSAENDAAKIIQAEPKSKQ